MGSSSNACFHPLCGLDVERPLLIVCFYDAFAGIFGFILLCDRIDKSWNDWKLWKESQSTPNLRHYNFEIVVWISKGLVFFTLVCLACVLHKAVRIKNITVLNLWISVTLVAAVLDLGVVFTSLVFFFETVHTRMTALVLFYQIQKVYFCYIVRFFIKTLRDKRNSSLGEADVFEFENGLPDIHNQVSASPDDLQKLAQYNGYQKHFEIDMNRLKISWNVPLGKGEFGVVFKGDLSEEDVGTKTVAVKVINPEVTDACGFKLMLGELKVMTYVGEHPNVVHFIGANTSQIIHRKLFIVLEFCGLGSLLQVLKGSRGLFLNLIQDGSLLCSEKTQNLSSADSEIISTLNLLEWSHQIAHGMEFLASKRLVHGDLACRNVLLTDQKVAKITDFGLSRRLYDCSVYSKKNSQKQIPWRNVSLESIVDHQFSTHSDVWSYGITLWEMFTLGEVPYPGCLFGDQFIRELRSGMRPAAPSYAPYFIRELMQSCWIKNPVERPSFVKIQKVLWSN